MRKWFLGLFLLCQVGYAQQPAADFRDHVQPAVFALTMVMLHDVVNPPAASRFYAYSLAGAYEIVAINNRGIARGSSFMKSSPHVVINAKPGSYNYRIAALYCILETGRLMLPSGFMLEEHQEKLLKTLKKEKVKTAVIDSAVAVAKAVALQVVNWSKSDNYGRLSTRLRYTPVKGEAYWYPTPPAYMEAVEPHWKIIRPMIIDTCDEFTPLPPVPFSRDTTSEFYALSKEVYAVSLHPSQEELNIASFWDCNPFAVSTAGHMAIGFKKITPGGHWMNIAGIAAEKAGLDFDRSVLVHTLTAMAETDAFISCWDEKYRSNRIRPETFINRYIDIKWKPLLQTPPFPEYTSGHSVMSTAAARVLTYLLGDHFAFTDDSEVMFEIPARSFSSFMQAANEAAISRLYGGIHYRDAIENGQDQGKKIGDRIVEKLKKAGLQPLIP
ncbi:vanadium-dependent haloperoxidase [uncultured Chitinophaga sp.]|jgi:PAP2 superfamily.|uniref:vanadium-dependent haloperoxidase n=1 Tax=uncultured Chitinophaga sp. TaxID=339340 RepID=UPI002639C52F|nr:vanadium-dependent haloperoxidase [uncultured Chitinophaga sp.]